MSSAVINVDVTDADPDGLFPITKEQFSMLITPHADYVIAYLSGTLDQLDAFFVRGREVIAARRVMADAAR